MYNYYIVSICLMENEYVQRSIYIHAHGGGHCQILNTFVDHFHSNAKVHPWFMRAMAVGRPTVHQCVFKIFTDCLVTMLLLAQNTQPLCISPPTLWTLDTESQGNIGTLGLEETPMII